MNAGEFNTEIAKLVNRGLTEGVFKGKMTTAEMIGVLEITKNGTLQTIQNVVAAQAQKPPLIHLPPNGNRIPPQPG